METSRQLQGKHSIFIPGNDPRARRNRILAENLLKKGHHEFFWQNVKIVISKKSILEAEISLRYCLLVEDTSSSAT